MKLKNIFFFILVSAALLSASSIRQVKDDVGFCWNPPGLAKIMAYLAVHDKTPLPAGPVIAGISPHDDHLYAGGLYYPLFKAVRAKEVIIIGVTHKTVRDSIGDPQNILILDDFSAWKGVKGDIPVSGLREFIRDKLDPACFITSNKAHELEHSIEALLPFLQYFQPKIRITPIMVTGMPFDKMKEISARLAEIIVSYMQVNKLQLGRDVAILISADANHYGADFKNTPFGENEEAHAKSIAQDLNWINAYLAGPLQENKLHDLTAELWGTTYRDYKNTYWCGKYSIPFGLLTASQVTRLLTGKELTGTLLRFGDTYSDGVLPVTQTGCGLTAVFSLKHWVSFFSMAFSLQ